MPWLLLLHISALICWCGSLLYLPALISANLQSNSGFTTPPPDQLRSMPRAVFTLIATPAALLAIGSGSAVFLVYGILEVWLLIKLVLVALLVFVHMLLGWLIVRAERGAVQYLRPGSRILAVTSMLLMVGIIALVLAKPLQELV